MFYRLNRMLTVVAVASVMCFSSTAMGGLIVFPTFPGSSQQFGDFQVYSLPFLNNLFPGQGFEVASSPGAIKDNSIVIATGSNNNDLNNNYSGMDNAYGTPNPGGGTSFFGTHLSPDPGSVGANPTNDSPDHWDANISSLSSFLNGGSGGQLLFFFNLNEENSGADALDGQNISLWASATLKGVGATPDKHFIFSSNAGYGASKDGLGNPTGPDPTTKTIANPTGYDINNPDQRWAEVHGAITVDAAGNFLHFGAKTAADGAGATQLNQNLGANNAAFAAFNAELDSIVRANTGIYSTLRIDLRMAALDNGFEQLFIQPLAFVGQAIPEPASFLIWGMVAAIGLTPVVSRRKRR